MLCTSPHVTVLYAGVLLAVPTLRKRLAVVLVGNRAKPSLPEPMSPALWLWALGGNVDGTPVMSPKLCVWSLGGYVEGLD